MFTIECISGAFSKPENTSRQPLNRSSRLRPLFWNLLHLISINQSFISTQFAHTAPARSQSIVVTGRTDGRVQRFVWPLRRAVY